MAWYGVLIIIFVKVQKRQEDGSIEEVVEQQNIYVDQILQDANKKDASAVVALLEAALALIMVEFPDVRNVTLQSDNACSYQGSLIIFAIHYLNIKHA